MCEWIELILRVREKEIGILVVREKVRCLWWWSLLNMVRMAREECKIHRGWRRVSV